MPSVQTNDVETYYERVGEGPPIIMAHGAGFDHRWWEPQVEALREEYEVITYDLRGHGRTGGGADWHQYEMPLYAMDLHRLVEQLGLEQPLIVGHSLGGMFLPEFAARYPASLCGLVLADVQVKPGAGLDEWLFRNVAHPAVILTTRLLGMDWADKLQAAIARLFADDDDGPPQNEDEDLAAYQESVEEYHERGEVTRIQRGLRRFSPAALGDVTVPTLGVYGSLERDRMARNERALAAGVADVETRAIPDAGHMLTWTHADEFNGILTAFAGQVFDDEAP